MKAVKIIQIILFILAVITLVYGLGVSMQAENVRGLNDAANEFEITITQKTNDEIRYDNFYCIFEFKIKNPSDKSITGIAGHMTISDCNGNQLSAGDVSFNGDFLPDSELFFHLNYEMEINEKSEKIWNSDLRTLIISYRITEVDGDSDWDVAVTCEDKIIKPCDDNFLSETYASAKEHLENEEYAEAILLFEQIKDYKDSADKLAAAILAEENAVENANEALYQSAVTEYNNKQYIEALTILNGLPEYAPAWEMVASMKEEATTLAWYYIEKYEYQSAIDFLNMFDYGEDSYYGAPYEITSLISACQDALNGVYSGVISSTATEFTVPEGTTELADNAFYGCENLTKITLPSGITKIGNAAFASCTSLTSITLPDSVTSIGENAFYECTSLTSVTLPSGLTAIKKNTFAGCISLKEIDLPSSLVSIGQYAFSECKAIKTLTIPDSVSSIDYAALDKCSALKEVSLPAIDGLRFRSLFSLNFPSLLTKVTLTSGEVLGTEFFKECPLTTVLLHDGLKVIETDAFYYCTIQEIVIPDSVTEIESQAFRYSGLTTFTLPAGVTDIAEYLLTGTEVETINIHGNVTRLGRAIIDRNVTVNFDGTKDEWIELSDDVTWYGGISYTVVCTDSTLTCSLGNAVWS